MHSPDTVVRSPSDSLLHKTKLFGDVNTIVIHDEAPQNAVADGEANPGLVGTEKTQKIISACEGFDLAALRDHANSKGGLMNDGIRRMAWPLLLGNNARQRDAPVDFSQLEKHRDEGQVQLDVDRSFIYYPEDESQEKRDARKLELSNVITAVLRQHPILNYFQGYHDIVQVFLLVLGIRETIPTVCRLSLLRIRDFMLPTMSGTVSHLHLLPAILSAADRGLYQHLSHTQPFFALAATLTLYAHDIEEYGDIARLFDFFLASEAVIPLYFFAVVVVSRKTELLEIPSDEPEMLHATLSKLPKPLDLEELIHETLRLFKDRPPQHLPGRAWTRVSSASVLKTTIDFEQARKQSLHDGEKFFHQEAAEIRRRDALQQRRVQVQALARRYQRPMMWIGAAATVALFAILARGNSLPFLFPGQTSVWLAFRQKMLEFWQHLK